MPVNIFKLIIGIVLLGTMFYYGLLDLESLGRAFDQPGLFALVLILLFGTLAVGGLRWFILLRAQNIPISLGKTMQIFLAGAFFNSFLPGMIGGDLVRGAYIIKGTERRRATALLSILMDRMMGMSGLLTLGVLVNALRPLDEFGVSGLAMYALFGAYVTGLVTLLQFGHRLGNWFRGILPGLGPRLGNALEELSQALDLYRLHFPRLLVCWVLSLLIYSVPVITISIVAGILQIGNLNTAEYASAGVWSLLMNNLPVTPGGIGVGEAVFARICIDLESVKSGAPYATVFLAFRALVMLATLPGLLAFIAYRNTPVGKAPGPAVETPSGSNS